MLRITTEATGIIQTATVWVGETEVIKFSTGTRYAETSKEIAEKVVAECLYELLYSAARRIDPELGVPDV